jgi:hypothetical protein
MEGMGFMVAIFFLAGSLAGSVLLAAAGIAAGLVGAAAGGIAFVLTERTLGVDYQPRTDRRVSVHTRRGHRLAGNRSGFSLPIAIIVTVGAALWVFYSLLYRIVAWLGLGNP